MEYSPSGVSSQLNQKLFNLIDLNKPMKDKEKVETFISANTYRLSDKQAKAWAKRFKGASNAYQRLKNAGKDACLSVDPDDMCGNCNCWKRTRANCS